MDMNDLFAARSNPLGRITSLRNSCLLIAGFLPGLLPTAVSSQNNNESSLYEVVGGNTNELCGIYRDDLSEAVNRSGDGSLAGNTKFKGFPIISNAPFEDMTESRRGGRSIGALKIDINNDGQGEQVFRTSYKQLPSRSYEDGYTTSEYLTIYEENYPRAEGYEDIPASTLPYALSSSPLKDWETLLSPPSIVDLDPSTATKFFEEPYQSFEDGYSSETETYIYVHDSKNYMSINNYKYWAAERADGKSQLIKRSMLAELGASFSVNALCVIMTNL